MLAHEVLGDGDDTVVFVHGFTQTRRSWLPVASAIARSGRRVVLVDAPRHGESRNVAADVVASAKLVRDVGGEKASYIGYSMGGRICLQLACDVPTAVERLVLLGATAGIVDEAERAERRRLDAALAGVLARDGIAAFLDDWLRGPLFATLTPVAAGVDDRLANDAAALAASLHEAGTGAMEPLWSRLDDVHAEVLVLAGSLDSKFTAVGHRMVEAIGAGARFQTIENAGHAAHLERPDDVTSAILAFLG